MNMITLKPKKKDIEYENKYHVKRVPEFRLHWDLYVSSDFLWTNVSEHEHIVD